MIFRQLFEPTSSTYTYLLGCPRTRLAVLVDPVLETVDRDVAVLAEHDLTLRYTLETHLHADHVTGGGALADRLGSRSVIHRDAGAPGADLLVTHGVVLGVGDLAVEVRATPGHTDGCVVYLVGDRVFTGDTLLIGGCGRTDFQQGDPGRLYDSIHAHLFTLPAETLVFPAHDYKGRTVSTIGEERAMNARLGGGRPRTEFIGLMNGLNLAYPKQIDRAVPANRRGGRPEPA